MKTLLNNFFIKSKNLCAIPRITKNIYPVPLYISSYKKNYFLPPCKKVLLLPSVNKQKVLPQAKDVILTNLSGLASLNDVLRIKHKTDLIYFNTFAKFMLMENAKIIYYLFKDPFKKDSFMQNIFKSFSLIYTKDMLKVDKELAALHKTRHLNTCQHILTIICNNFYINCDDLLNNIIITKVIDFTHYKKIPIGLLIEYFIFNENIQNLKFNPLINIKFIDHENHMLGEKTHIFNRDDSLRQIGQMHADLLFYTLFGSPEGITQILKRYRDIKADYRGPAKGHFTLIPHLYTDMEIALQYINDHITSIKKQIMKLSANMANIAVTDSLTQTYIALKRIKVDKSLTLKQRILAINQMLLNISCNPLYSAIDLNCTLASDITIDYAFIQDILPIIQNNAENNIIIFDVDILFPKDNKINKNQYNKFILDIIDKILPKELRKPLQDNFKKYIENDLK